VAAVAVAVVMVNKPPRGPMVEVEELNFIIL
jgi:hypothetical protein